VGGRLAATAAYTIHAEDRGGSIMRWAPMTLRGGREGECVIAIHCSGGSTLWFIKNVAVHLWS